MEKEEEISNEDVKAEFEKLEQERAESPKESSTEEKEASTSTSEVVKSVIEEVDKPVEEKEPETIPYTRFKEVNDRKTALEELAESAKDFIETDPTTGKLRLKIPQETVKEAEVKEKKGLELSEEEQLALDSVQLNVIKKIIAHENQERESKFVEAQEAQRTYQKETNDWWGKCVKEYPELGKEGFKELPLYKRAIEILKEQHIVWSADKKTFYIPPKAQFFSLVQAEKELNRDKVKTTQAKIEEKKNQKSNVFVEKKSVQQQAKKKTDEKEFESLSPSEQDAALQEQWNEAHPDGVI